MSVMSRCAKKKALSLDLKTTALVSLSSFNDRIYAFSSLIRSRVNRLIGALSIATWAMPAVVCTVSLLIVYILGMH